MLKWWSKKGIFDGGDFGIGQIPYVEGGVIAFICENDEVIAECQDGFANGGQVELDALYMAEEFDYPGEAVDWAWAKPEFMNWEDWLGERGLTIFDKISQSLHREYMHYIGL